MDLYNKTRYGLRNSYTFSRELEGELDLYYQDYSDNNCGVEVHSALIYEACASPKLLKFSIHGEYYNVKHQTAYSEDFIPIKHPYWIPEEYILGYVMIQWRHHPKYPLYAGHELLYYDLSGRAGYDTENSYLYNYRGELNWRFSKSGRIIGSFDHTLSKNYKAINSNLEVNWTF